jgi:hypothetical protein
MEMISTFIIKYQTSWNPVATMSKLQQPGVFPIPECKANNAGHHGGENADKGPKEVE